MSQLKLDKNYNPIISSEEIYNDNISGIANKVEELLERGAITRKQAEFLLNLFIKISLKNEINQHFFNILGGSSSSTNALFINSRIQKEEYVNG